MIIGYVERVWDELVVRKDLESVIDKIKSNYFNNDIDKIRSSSKEEQKKLKPKMLPAFFPTLNFDGKNSLTEEAIPTGIMQFDLDVVKSRSFHTQQGLAQLLNIPQRHLKDLKTQGKGPVYRRTGSGIEYTWYDVVDWLEAS